MEYYPVYFGSAASRAAVCTANSIFSIRFVLLFIIVWVPWNNSATKNNLKFGQIRAMQHVVLSQALLGMLRHTAQLRVAKWTMTREQRFEIKMILSHTLNSNSYEFILMVVKIKPIVRIDLVTVWSNQFFQMNLMIWFYS